MQSSLSFRGLAQTQSRIKKSCTTPILAIVTAVLISSCGLQPQVLKSKDKTLRNNDHVQTKESLPDGVQTKQPFPDAALLSSFETGLKANMIGVAPTTKQTKGSSVQDKGDLETSLKALASFPELARFYSHHGSKADQALISQHPKSLPENIAFLQQYFMDTSPEVIAFSHELRGQ